MDWPKDCLEVISENPLVIKNPKTWYHSHSYGGWGKFFKGLAQEKILATRCSNPDCKEKRLWVPPRANCPDCWHDMDWVEAPQTGVIYTHSVVTYPGELFQAARRHAADQYRDRGYVHQNDELAQRGASPRSA